MGDLAADEAGRKGTVTGTTHENQARTHRRFREWCDSVGLVNNYFLDNICRDERTKTVGAFVMTMHGEIFAGPAYDTQTKGTTRRVVSHMALTFRGNDWTNPIKTKAASLGGFIKAVWSLHK